MKKILSLVLSVLMLISILPMTAGAAATDTWDILSFVQDGPEFSVVAEGFEAADTSYTFTAVAYIGADVHETKAVTVAPAGDKLTASVNFEESGVEADVNISSVEVTLTNSSSEVVGETKTFAVTAPTASNGEDSVAMINGFYEPTLSTSNITKSRRNVWRDDVQDAENFPETHLGDQWSEGTNLHDHNLVTKSTYGPTMVSGSKKGLAQYITELATAITVDKAVVIYNPMSTVADEMRFYLTKSLGNRSSADTYFADYNETTHGDIYYLGYRGTHPGVDIGGGMTKLTFDADGVAYKYLVADMGKNSNYGYVYEFQTYQKVTNSYAVASNKPASVTFKQDGAVFSVLATKLDETAIECTSCTLTAVARDSEGYFVDQKVATGAVDSGTFSASVNFEEGGKEARVDIASVVLTLTDEDNGIVATETFTVTPQSETDGVYNNFTNGFYEPVVDGETVTVSESKMTRYTKETLTKTHNYDNGTGLTDHNLTTRNANNQTADGGSNDGIYWNEFVNLSADAKIDRVVAYPVSLSGVRFFLSEAACSTDGDMNAYLSALVPETTAYTYLGDKDTAKSVDALTGMNRFVFDTDGGTYRSLIVDYRTGSSSGNYDIQAYRKVTGTKKASEIIEKDDREELVSEVFNSPNIALHAPAFSYGSAAGTDASYAVDGDETTAWISANTSDRRDFLILDLGAKYSIGGLKLTLAEGSDSNFTVYGMNATPNSTRNNSVSQNVPATEFSRKALTGTLNLTPGEEEKVTSICYDEFRYVVFEQAAGAGTDFGFAEIEVYTMGRVDASYEAKPVAKTKGELVVLSRHSGSNDGDSKLADAKIPATDSDPSTTASVTDLSQGWNQQVVQTVMIDLGRAQKVSQIAYQSASNGHPTEYKYFILFGANSLPGDGALVTKDGDNKNVTALQNVDVFARFDGVSDLTASLSASTEDTGLLIFDVPEIHQDKTYKYIGLMKYDVQDAVLSANTPQLKTTVGTLHAYTKCEDVVDMVEEAGENRIMETEVASVTADTVSYSATLWNGNIGGNVIGVLTNAETSQKYYVDCGALVPGAYNSIGFSQAVTDGTTGAWELTLLCGRKIYDRIDDLGAKKLTRAEFYTGESLYGNINSGRVGTTAQSSGTVDSGIVGMVILKPNANAVFGASDVYDLIFAEAPAGNEGGWNYSLRYTVPADAPGNVGDEYTACLLSNNDSLLGELPIAIPVFNESAVESAFAAPATNAIADLITGTHADYFGSELAAKVSAICGDAAAKQAFGEKFELAQVAFADNVFDDGLTGIDAIPAAAQAALVIDATLKDTDVKETIAAYGASMPLIFNTPYYDADDFEEILPEVLNKITLGTEDEENAKALATAYKRAIALSSIAGAGEDLKKVEDAIVAYQEELGIDELLAATEQEPVSIAKKIATDMATIKASYAGGMTTAVDGIIKELDGKDENPTYEQVGSPAPSGNNKKPTSQVPSLPYDLWDEQDVVPTQKPESAISKETGFQDIDAHTWAHSAIKMMKERKIIDGVSSDAFDPDGLLTREQTAKLIILSTNLETTMEDNGYRDCVRGAWYYPFVSSAKQNGLINGLSRTEFGLGKNITRQDLAVMIYRALDKLDLLDGKEEKAFADDAAISSYAKEAVGVLGNMGIITGFEDGSFGPGQHATRAQAAVIFARFLDVVDAAAAAAANAGEEG